MNAHGAGGAVVAAAAELGAQGIPDGLDFRRFFPGQRGGIADGGQILGELLVACHAGDDHGDGGVLHDIAKGQGSVVNGPSGQGLHADEADVLFLTFGNELRALVFHQIVGEHDCLHPVHVQGLFEDLGGVSGEADVPDGSGGLGVSQGFQRPAGGGDGFQVLQGRVVELVEVDVVRAEIAQAGFHVLLHGLLRQPTALGGQDKLVPDALQAVADVFLADGIAPGGIDVVDARLQQPVHERFGALRVNALNGDAPKAQPGDFQTCFAQYSVFHLSRSFLRVQWIQLLYSPPGQKKRGNYSCTRNRGAATRL